MNVEFRELMALIAVALTSVGLTVTLIGVAWKLSRHLTGIEVQLATLVGQTVTHEQCSIKRKDCPCVKEIETLKRKLEK